MLQPGHHSLTVTGRCCAAVPARPDHSGRTLIRLGRAASRSFLISAGVTRQDSRDRERRFCSSVRWWRPELDTRELDTFSDTSAVRPVARWNRKTRINQRMDKCVLKEQLNKQQKNMYQRSAPGFCPWGCHSEIGWAASELWGPWCSSRPHPWSTHHRPPGTEDSWKLKQHCDVQNAARFLIKGSHWYR